MDRNIRIIKLAQPAGTVPEEDYDPSFPNRLGMASMINQAIENVYIDTQRTTGTNTLEWLMAQKKNPGTALGKSFVENVQKNPQTGELDYAPLSAWVSSLGIDIETVKPTNLSTAVSAITAEGRPEEEKAAVEQLDKYITGGARSQDIRTIENQIKADPNFQAFVKGMVAQQTPRFQQTGKRTVISQVEGTGIQEPVQDLSNPLTSGKFESMQELKETLIALGPKPETYNKIFELAGKENEDNIKDALSKFYQGVPAALNTIYDILIKSGAASPIDEDILGGLMEKHPEVFPKEETVEASLIKDPANGFFVLQSGEKTLTVKNSWSMPFLAKAIGWDEKGNAEDYLKSKVGQTMKVAGLFGENYTRTVCAMNGLFITPEGQTMQKVASGGIGSTTNMVYDLAGPLDKRYCPKLRNVISTFQCRYNCLDGFVIGDAQVLCGEAIYRQSIMDKFSTENLSPEGKLEGGYLRDRFQIEQVTHEHPALLKPGQRMQPINEDAWITEKRLQELRREEGKKRGYNETTGDPKDLYNFDQHEILKGPQAPNLFGESGRTKTASFNLKQVKTADVNPPWLSDKPVQRDEPFDPKKQTVNLFGDYFASKEYTPTGGLEIKVYEGDPSKGEMFSSTIGQTMNGKLAFHKNIDNYLRKKLIRTVEKALLKKQAFNLKRIKTAGPMDPAKVQAGTVCSKCGLKGKEGQTACMKCGGKMRVQPMTEAIQESGALPKQDLKIKAYVANGVYKVTQGAFSAYGESLKEAMSKLAVQVAPEESDTIDEVDQDLTDLIQDEPVPVDGFQQPVQPVQPMQQVQPLQPLQPLGQPVQQPENQEAIVLPEGTQPESTEVVEEEQPDINADALDSFLEAVEDKTPEAQKEMEELKEKIVGFGPDKKPNI